MTEMEMMKMREEDRRMRHQAEDGEAWPSLDQRETRGGGGGDYGDDEEEEVHMSVSKVKQGVQDSKSNVSGLEVCAAVL